MKKTVLTLFIILLAINVSSAATWYIDPNGSDSGTCQISTPCRTFPRAQSLASSGDTIYFRGGLYPAWHLVTVSKSGLTLLNYPGEKPEWNPDFTYPRLSSYPDDFPVILHSGVFSINADNTTVQGMTIKRSRGCGFQIRSDDNKIMYNEVEYCFHVGISIDRNWHGEQYARNEIAHNTVTRCNYAREVTLAPAEWGNLSTNIAIRGNNHHVHHNISRFSPSAGLEAYGSVGGIYEYNILYGNGITQFHLAEDSYETFRWNICYGVKRPDLPAEHQQYIRSYNVDRVADGSGSVDIMCELWFSQDHDGVVGYWDRGHRIYENLIVNLVNGIRLGHQLGRDRSHPENTIREVSIYNNTIIGSNKGVRTESIYGHALCMLDYDSQGASHIGPGNVIKNNIFWQTNNDSITHGTLPTADVAIGPNLWSKAPGANYQHPEDPRYPSYGPIDMTEYFRRTIWSNLEEGDITMEDAHLLVSAAHAINTGDADDFFLSLNIPYSGQPDMGMNQLSGGPSNAAPVATVSSPIGPQSVAVGGNLTFNGTVADADSGSEMIHCIWDFDGVRQQWSADNPSPLNCNVGSVTFPNEGTYNISFYGSDSQGAGSNTITIPVTVGSPVAVTGAAHIYDFEAGNITGDTGSANDPLTNNGGVVTGGSEPTTPGYGSTGAILNGTNQYFTLPAATLGNSCLGGTDLDGTWYIAIRPASVSDVQFLVGVNTDAEEKLAIKLVNNIPYLHWGYNNGDSYQSIPISGAGLQIGRDYVIGLSKFSGGFYRMKVLDATTGSYMQDITAATTPLNGEPNTAQVDLAIGSRSDNDKHFNGNVWFFRAYDAPHSDAEMVVVMENTASQTNDVTRCYLNTNDTFSSGDTIQASCEVIPTTVDQTGGTITLELEAGENDLVCNLQTPDGPAVTLLQFEGVVQSGMTTDGQRINATANGIQLNGGSLGGIDLTIPSSGPGAINYESDGYIDTTSGSFTSMCGVAQPSESWDCTDGPVLFKRGDRVGLKICSDDNMSFTDGAIGNITVTVTLSNGDDLVFMPVWGNSTSCWGFVSQEIESDMRNLKSLQVDAVTAMVRDTITNGSPTRIINDAGDEMASYDLPQLLIDAFNKMTIMGGAYRFVDPGAGGSAGFDQ